jgi:aerobic-type carbon monoxide dehydrogenase small subunit (CoxS/CutS family)
MSEHRITLTVNGEQREVEVPARWTLAELLRERLDLTATHLGCEHGVCGACTVLIDGEPSRSCVTLAVQADGADVRTLEGVTGPDGGFHPIQEGLWEKHGMQCGFCTPGIVMSMVELLDRNPKPERAEVEDVLGGHICRCTGYTKILEAVDFAVEKIDEQGRAS